MSISEHDNDDLNGSVHGLRYAAVWEEVINCPNLSHLAFRVWVTLQWRAGQNDAAWPSHQSLADTTDCSVASVKRALAELVELQLIQVKQQKRGDGSQTSNRYAVWPKRFIAAPESGPRLDVANLDGTEASPYSGRVTKEHPPQFTGDPPGGRQRATKKELPTENQLKRNNQESPIPLKLVLETTDESHSTEEPFEVLWKNYPRKIEKAGAKAAFQATVKRGNDPNDLVTATKNYRLSCKRNETPPTFVKHGKTFFGPKEPWRDYLAKPAELDDKYYDEEGDEISESSWHTQRVAELQRSDSARWG